MKKTEDVVILTMFFSDLRLFKYPIFQCQHWASFGLEAFRRQQKVFIKSLRRPYKTPERHVQCYIHHWVEIQNLRE